MICGRKLANAAMALVALGLYACTGGIKLGEGERAGKGDEKSSGAETEEDGADQPQMVSGAFLVGCGAVDETAAGDAGYGCVVHDAKTHEKVAKSDFELAVEVSYADGSKESPEVVKAPPESSWHVYFDVAEGKRNKVSSIGVAGKVAAKSVKLATSSLDYDPSEWRAFGKPSGAHVIFVTSNRFRPGIDFNAIARADVICANAASATGLVGEQWRALLSAKTSSAKNRLGLSGAVVDVDGTEIAKNADEFWHSEHLASITVDEHGDKIYGAEQYVWTGTDELGESATDDCFGWGSELDSRSGVIGKVGDGSGWLDAGVNSCNDSHHLYCISL